MLTGAEPTDWLVFPAVVLIAMLLDRLAFGRGGHFMSFREASIRSIGWMVVGLGFGVWVYLSLGKTRALEYLTAYIVEESLSIDNLFVFLVLFTYFGVKEKLQRRVLTWGIIGAIVLRGVFVVAGTALLHRFHWMMYIFGAFLVFTGLKLGFRKEDTVEPEKNLALRIARKYLRTTPKFEGDLFFTRQNGLLYATPLFLVLIVVEFTDVVFAIDSVPAVLAISDDVYVVYTSNVFAILGLRALYFMLAGMMNRFHHLGTGLAFILVFIGAEMLLSEVYKLSNAVSLGVVGLVLAISVTVSLLRPQEERSSRPSQNDGKRSSQSDA